MDPQKLEVWWKTLYVEANNFFRITWVMLFKRFVKKTKRIQREQDDKIVFPRCDHGENLRIKVLWSFVKQMVFFTNFVHLELHNKIVLLKKEIGLSKRWL